LEDCSESYFVATDQGEKLVGYCVCSLGPKSAHLISIAVQTDYRRRAVATTLLHRVIEFLKEQSIVELWLEVKPKNVKAISLYSKLGFERTELLKGYYSDGSDAVGMRLTTTRPPEPVNAGS
jgi:ribosomal-protein-alanine acetyltransferase